MISLDNVIDAVIVAEAHVYILVEVGAGSTIGTHGCRASTNLFVLIGLMH